VPLLTEHRLRLGDRPVTLLEGPAGWGECSPLPGYPSDPASCRAAAEEAARDGFPPARRTSIPVNALVDGPFLVHDVRGYPAVKVKVRDAAGLALVRAVRDAVGPNVGVRVDANGAWDVDTAVSMIAKLARFDLEYVEQPSRASVAGSTCRSQPTSASVRLLTPVNCGCATRRTSSC